MFGLVRSKWCV